jgi:hypothetical protein
MFKALTKPATTSTGMSYAPDSRTKEMKKDQLMSLAL